MTRVGTRFLRAMSVRVVGGLLIAMAALLALELAVFGGGRTSQAMTAGSVDISVQSGTEMAFLAKGVPGKAVAALAGPPTSFCCLIPACEDVKQ